MFERFTDRARQSVRLAKEEARLLSHNYIGTEHLLLGVLCEGEGLGAQALNAVGIRLEETRREVEAEVGRGTIAPAGHLPFTPRAKTSLEHALRESVRLGHGYIGTEHVLLGVLREEEGVAAKLLSRRLQDLGHLRRRVVALMQGATAQAAGAEGVPLSREDEGAGVPWEPVPDGDLASPRCSRCGSDLGSSATYRILEVPEQAGEGRASVLFVFCRSCGQTLDSLVAPEDD